ncbi:MAG: hypothetical protein RBQ99_10785 [Trichlorobacter sp.]|jgi:hypothetical protein|nr:hypothetical protein [Trichlorobacter sp.]
MHIKSLQNLDLEKMAAAIEKDAGQELPGLREGLQDARAGRFGGVHTPRSRQNAYENRKIQARAQRIPGGLLSPEAAAALQTLLERGAPSKVAAINQALIAAAH